MPTVSTHRPPAHWDRRRTSPSWLGSTVHIWEVPLTSSHRWSQVPLAVPAIIRSINLPLARFRMRYTLSPTRSKAHSCLGSWLYLPRRMSAPFSAFSTASITLPEALTMV